MSPASSPLSLGHSGKAPSTEALTGLPAFFNSILPPERPGRHPAQGWTHVGEDALCHVFRGRLPFQKTMAQSGDRSEYNVTLQPAGPLPPGPGSPEPAAEVDAQTLGWQQARSLPGLQVLLPILSLLPMTFLHSGIPNGHSDPEGSGRPGPSVPPRALAHTELGGAPRPSVVEGEPVCPGHPAQGV